MSDFESGSTTTFPAPAAASRMVVADFDGDGDADILYQTGANGTGFQYALNNGGGNFTLLAQMTSPFAGLALPDNGGGTHYAGDFDGDGDIDLIAALATTSGSYFRNDGFAFVQASSLTLPAPAAATRMVTGDFDGDGDEDILYQTGANGTAFQYARSNGDGTFTILSQASSPFAGVTFVDHNGSNFLAADFDGDGDVDVIATPNASQGEYYRNDNGTFAEGSTATFPLPAAGGRMTAGDFDADGDADILFQTGANGTEFQYARSNGDGTFTILALSASPFSGLTLPDHNGGNYHAADFDGDGDTDLLAGVNGTAGSYFYQVGKPPELVSSTPADNSTGVAVGANIVLTFDEAVSKGSGVISIVRGDGVVVEAISVSSAQVTGSGTTWTIDPSVTLAGLTNYSIQLDAGTFRDVDGAIFAGIDDMVTLSFTTTAGNSAPTQATNAGLTLNEGASGTITAARLDFNDAEQADTAITYTVTSLASNGTLRRDGVALALNGTFTQADINNGLLTYLHDGSETTSASFGFSVSDGAGGSVAGQSFAFTVTPVNDAPAGTDKTVTIAEDGTYTFGAADFGFGDTDGGSLSQVVITSLPGEGTLYLNGTAIPVPAIAVSAADITAGLLTFRPDANENGAAYTSFTFQVRDNGGTANGGQDVDQTPNTITIDVTAVDDAAVAVNDLVSTDENVVAAGSVFGNDSDADGPALAVSAVNGVAGNVGTQITLASGALLTLNANGTYSYDPNGAFDYLVSLDTAIETSASNFSAVDSFTYTLANGNTATVEMIVFGEDGAGDELWGNAGDNTITGTSGNDFIDLSQGGDDSANGGDGDDGFFLGAELGAGDSVNGGAGGNDQVGLRGNYTGVNAANLIAGSFLNIEVVALLPGFDFVLNMVDFTISEPISIFGGNLGAGDDFTFNATDGTYKVFGGKGIDSITTGAGDDGIYFGPGKFTPSVDRVDGGAGVDQLALDGHYTLTLDGTAIQNIETIALLKGTPADLASYNLTLDDTLVGAGKTVTVWGTPVETALWVDGNAESDGNLRMFGGRAGDTLTGGAGDDWFWGGLGGDLMQGGAGGDTFYYESADQSRAGAIDTLLGFDDAVDKIDLGFAVTGFAGPLSGALDMATIGTQLEAAAGSLGAGQALVFTADAGSLDGNTFLLIDGNGTAGYQASTDYLIMLPGPASAIDNLGMFI